MAYSVIALLLLGYVLAQIYTSILAQEIVELKQERYGHKESLSRLTSKYVSLSSRERISNYCDTVLGMQVARDGNLERFAVLDDNGDFLEPVEFTERHSPLSDPYRFSRLRDSVTPAK